MRSQIHNMKKFFDFNEQELKLFSKLNTQKKIQDFLNTIPANFEKTGATSLSPREVLKQNRAHCIEGAVLAAVILWYHGQKPLLLDLVSNNSDDDHVVALFKQGKFWGAISKTNHAVLRYREPVYRDVRELVMSFFHEYFKDSGKKTLRSYSAPFDLSKIKDKTWLTCEESIWEINNDLTDSKHYKILNQSQIKNLRLAEPIEIEAGKLTEWKRK